MSSVTKKIPNVRRSITCKISRNRSKNIANIFTSGPRSPVMLTPAMTSVSSNAIDISQSLLTASNLRLKRPGNNNTKQESKRMCLENTVQSRQAHEADQSDRLEVIDQTVNGEMIDKSRKCEVLFGTVNSNSNGISASSDCALTGICDDVWKSSTNQETDLLYKSCTPASCTPASCSPASYTVDVTVTSVFHASASLAPYTPNRAASQMLSLQSHFSPKFRPPESAHNQPLSSNFVTPRRSCPLLGLDAAPRKPPRRFVKAGQLDLHPGEALPPYGSGAVSLHSRTAAVSALPPPKCVRDITRSVEPGRSTQIR